MAEILRKPLVLKDGLIQQIQAGEILDADVQEVNLISATNGEVGAITMAQPVYVSASGTVKLAKADALASAHAYALCYEASVPAGNLGYFQVSGQIELADWTAIAGTATLVPNAYYFLDPSSAGKITVTAPSTVGQVVTVIGMALSTTLLDINTEKPILL